jgi:ubiquinone/menaquinone biosynthesis C-methylase UbiE
VLTQALVSLLLLLLSGGPVYGQGQTNPVTGRAIAPVMGIGGADWLDRPEREQEEQPEKAIKALQLRPGMQIGEIGAGTGFYALRIARRILPGGTVFANDIQPRMLELLRRKAESQKISNLKTVLGSESDPGLPEHVLDLVLMVDVYHELSHSEAVLQNIAKELKPGGQLVLLEFRKEDPNVPIRPEHKMSVAEVKAELGAEGYFLDRAVETLPMQHILFFTRPQ